MYKKRGWKDQRYKDVAETAEQWAKYNKKWDIKALIKNFVVSGRLEKKVFNENKKLIDFAEYEYNKNIINIPEVKVKTFIIGPLDTRSYVVYCPQSLECVVIDPCYPVHEIIRFITKYSLSVKYVLNTHGDFDHTTGNKTIKEITNCKIICSKQDCKMLDHYPDIFADEFHYKKFGRDREISIILTPGHTKGSVCYKIENNLFSGDTIMKNKTGFDYGVYEIKSEIIQSIKNKLFKLPDETIIYPGHTNPTTIGIEKKRGLYK